MSKLPRILPLVAIAIGGVVAVRAVGAGPEFLQGARAWAEEAVAGDAAKAGEGEPAKAAPIAACTLTDEQLAQQAGLSIAELNVIQALKTRRGELDARDNDFATMLPLMAAAEEKLDAKLAAMNALKAEMQTLLGQVSEREQAEVDRLVKVYSAMRPREAAAVFASLDDSVRLPVAAAMRERSLAAIMAQMQPAAARDLTEKLARRFEAQRRAAELANASADTPAPAATTPAPAPAPAANRPATTAPARSTPQRSTPPRQQSRPASAPATQAATPPAQQPAASTTRPRQTVQ